MKVKTLDYRRRDDRIAAGLGAKSRQVSRCLLPADAFQTAFKRKVDRNFLEPAQRRGPPIEGDAGQLAYANLGILQRCRLRVQPEIETVGVIVFVDENLRAFFR